MYANEANNLFNPPPPLFFFLFFLLFSPLQIQELLLPSLIQRKLIGQQGLGKRSLNMLLVKLKMWVWLLTSQNAGAKCVFLAPNNAYKTLKIDWLYIPLCMSKNWPIVHGGVPSFWCFFSSVNLRFVFLSIKRNLHEFLFPFIAFRVQD